MVSVLEQEFIFHRTVAVPLSCEHSRMSEPYWKKRMREAKARKRAGGWYSKQATRRFDDMTEGTSFWGHKGLQRRFGKVDGVKVYRRRISP